MQNDRTYPVVVFDGSCGFCQNSLKHLQAKFDFKNVSFLPYSDENAKLWNFSKEVISQHHKYMFYLENSTDCYKGYFAFQKLFSRNESLKAISFFMKFKVVEVIGRGVYILISKNRRILSGRNASCGI